MLETLKKMYKNITLAADEEAIPFYIEQGFKRNGLREEECLMSYEA